MLIPGPYAPAGPAVRAARAGRNMVRMLCGLLFLGLFSVSGCLDSREFPGVVAEVNDVPIYFSELDAQRNILFSGLTNEGLPPPDNILQEQYRYALRQIIVQELARQYIEAMKIPVDANRLVSNEVFVQSDYPTGSFRDMLLQSGLSPTMWHSMMTRSLYLSTLAETVLRPMISITAAEVEHFYAENKGDFALPEQWHFMQITGEDKAVVERARDIFLQTSNATLAQQTLDVSMRDIRMDKERLPEEAIALLSSLAPYNPSKIIRLDSDYRIYVMLEKLPPTLLDAAETYKRVERRLVEEKMFTLLNDWADNQIGSSKIRIARQLQAGTVFQPPVPVKRPPRSNATLLPVEDDLPGEAEEPAT